MLSIIACHVFYCEVSGRLVFFAFNELISGPRNSFYCLGHFKNVYDDDDDD